MAKLPRHIVRFRKDGNSIVVVLPKYFRNEMGLRHGDLALVTLVDDCVVVDRLDPNSVRTMTEAREAVALSRSLFEGVGNGRAAEQRA